VIIKNATLSLALDVHELVLLNIATLILPSYANLAARGRPISLLIYSSYVSFRVPVRSVPVNLVAPVESASPSGSGASSTPGIITATPYQPRDPGPLLIEGPTINDDTPSPCAKHSTAQNRSIDSIRLTGDEITMLFSEYYSYYHPFFPLFIRQYDADDLYNKSQFIFWTICVVASRPYASHPISRCRTPDLCMSLGKALQNWMYIPMAIENWKYWHVQAWLLLAQYPPIHEEDPDNLVWVSSPLELTVNIY
jgi:hypothetical protein